MTTDYNVKIELNGEILFVDEKSFSKPIDHEFFYKFIGLAKLFTLNDTGEKPGINDPEYADLKNELKEFDVSEDKEFGGEWDFEVNEKSRSLMIKAFKAYEHIGHTRWTLKGDDFEIEYIESGDMYELMDGPSGPKTVDTHFIIKAEKKCLEDINSILKSYKTKLGPVSAETTKNL